jgi:hypothetical protein
VDYLSLTDLFIVGLALDITGAWLLAKGLLISPSTIAAISATLWGANPETARDRCANRVDAEFGLTYLGLGFFLQAVGYSLEISGVGPEFGIERFVVALAMALVVSAAAIAIYKQSHRGRVERLMSETEAEDSRDSESNEGNKKSPLLKEQSADPSN